MAEMAEMAAANKQSTQPKITKGIKMACRALKNVAKSLMPLPPAVMRKVLGLWSFGARILWPTGIAADATGFLLALQVES